MSKNLWSTKPNVITKDDNFSERAYIVFKLKFTKTTIYIIQIRQTF